MQALSEALSHKVMREARAQQDELDAEDMPEGAISQVCQHDNSSQTCYTHTCMLVYMLNSIKLCELQQLCDAKGIILCAAAANDCCCLAELHNVLQPGTHRTQNNNAQ